VLNVIKNSGLENNDIVNIYRIDKDNVGDFYCSPHLYFEELGKKKIDLLGYKNSDKRITNHWIREVSDNALVIGGGGLMDRNAFEKQLKLFEYLSEKKKRTVIWGAGHNSKYRNDFGKKINYNIDLKKFGLVGVRDYRYHENWVPCVSCMHPFFDKDYTEKQEIGIIYHKDSIKNKGLLKRLDHYPSTSNTSDLDDLISFIGKSNTIVTDSYHAMYWSFLLNKKVLVIPNSSKFYDFKYQPVITTFETFEIDIKKANSYTGILQECREINIKFADRVFDYLNL
jgi:hypothetical protein